MGGTNSGSSQHNSSSSSGSINTSSATMGRERAIEALIDREPQGDYYRAARVIDEAVPIAQVSRPNLITKSALIEQAFALSQYDIDSLSKYDAQYLKIHEQDPQRRRSNNETRKVDALQKERIFHYQTHVLATKGPANNYSQSNSAPIIGSSHETDPSTMNAPTSTVPPLTSNAISVAPPPNLVASLRRVFDGKTIDQGIEEPALSSEPVKLMVDTKVPVTRKDSGSLPSRFELRHLLQAIANHPIFTTSVASSAVAVAEKQDHSATATTINYDDEHINLEKLIMTVTKQQVSNSEESDKETSLQGLLIVILSLLTKSQSGFSISAMGDDVKREFIAETEAPRPKVEERQDTDLPPQSMLQVGALLSLLPLESSSTASTSSTGNNSIIDTVDTDSESHRLNPEMLDYFASAAAIYQERWEIRKARRLARMQAPPPQPESVARCHTPPMTSSKQIETSMASNDNVAKNEENHANREQQEDVSHGRTNPTVNAETPTARDQSAPDMEFSLRTEDDDIILMTPTNNNSVTPINSVRENRNIDPPAYSTTELMIASDQEERRLLSSDHVNDSSDDALNDDDQCDNRSATVIPRGMSGESLDNNSRNNIEPSNEEHCSDEDEDDDEDVDEPSSSSSSESSDDDDDDAIGDSDDADALDTDDEDAVLRQAMALSMAEQEGIDAEGQIANSAVSSRLSSQLEPPGDVKGITECDQNSDQEDDGIPAAETFVSLGTVGGSIRNEEDDDANLPPFPNPPASYQLLQLSGSNVSVLAPKLTEIATETASPTSQLDPSELTDFGSIPSCYVLFHFLRYTELELDQRLSSHAKAQSSPIVVSGGVGSSLFRSDADRPDSILTTDKSCMLTLQLLVASTLLMIDRRNEAIDNLRKSIEKEQRMAHDGIYDSEDENTDALGDDESSRFPSLSGEEDDPALTLAMNYVEDDAPLSSESLESKGMTRKAAAAAYDAAALVKSLRKCTNRWKYEVHLASSCVACSLQIFRIYLQSLVRKHFLNAKLAGECSNCLGLADFHLCFPESVQVKISKGLSSLMSIGTQSSLLAMMSGDVTETERLFQSCYIYKAAIVVWGECIPLLHCSDSAQSTLLKSLINECSGFDNPLSHLTSLEKLNNFPNSDVETQFYKLCTICRRLRVGDLLDNLVSRPLHYVAEMSVDSSANINHASQFESVESNLSRKSVSSLLAFLASSIESLVGDHSELKYFYLALCHRFQSCVLLLDGFFLENETELDDRHALIATAKTLTTGDTVRVAAGPSAALQFDPTKCSDSIAVYTGQDDDSKVVATGIYSVHQRASKVWGTVLSTQKYSPKTGVHRWAVRLDKCERGHVFIGVTTSQAIMKTYVGGDKHGWGMIGTQALWHDRRKIRGDYGSTFRTGSTIIVTLDTDIGTLSFSSWKDGTSSSSLSVDPLIQNIVSPRKGGQTGGIVEDWGIAFEGLPLDAKLYPAIALYQRDDRVTLLTVESPTTSRALHGSNDIVGGRCYYPLLSTPTQQIALNTFADNVRRHNDFLAWDGICYATSVLELAVTSIRNNDTSTFVLTSILPSLGATLCMLPPSVPILSARFASYVMPYVSKCILELERYLLDSKQYNAGIFSDSILTGHWIIRTKPSDDSGIEYEEYEMDITNLRTENDSTYFEGRCIPKLSGKSKGVSGRVIGYVSGSALTFVEDWYSVIGDEEPKAKREPDCFVITARLNMDGAGFEGIYRRSASGNAGQIAGRLLTKKSISKSKSSCSGSSSLGGCAAVLCSALSHLAVILGDAASSELDYSRDDLVGNTKETREKQAALKSALSRSLLSNSSSRRSLSDIKEDISSLLKKYCHSTTCGDMATNKPSSNILHNLNDFVQNVGSWDDGSVTAQERLGQQVAYWDGIVTLTSGGLGSFSVLSPTIYSDVRKQIICSILYHIRFDNTCAMDPAAWTADVLKYMQLVWRNSLKILEDGVRYALSIATTNSVRDTCSDVCRLYSKTSSFLLSLNIKKAPSCVIVVEEFVSELSSFFSLVGNENDLKFIESEMVLATQRGLLRYSSLSEIVRIVGLLNIKSISLIESLTVGFSRQLGRGKVDRNQVWRTATDDNLNVESMPYLDGNYLFRLDGSDDKVITAMRKLIISLFTNIGQIAEQLIARRSEIDCPLKFDSLLLSILTVFITHFRRDDFDDIISESRLFVFLPKILSMNRYSVQQTMDSVCTEGDSQLQFATLVKIFQRDVARAILRCSVALTHVLSYQGIVDVGTSSSGCVDFALRELKHVFLLVEQDSRRILKEEVRVRSKKDWQYYVTTDESGNVFDASKCSGKTYVSGLTYLQHHGSLLTNFSLSSSTKSSQSHKTAPGGPVRHVMDVNNHSTVSFAQQLLSHWMIILCSMLRYPVSINYILSHSQGLSLLLNQIGLFVECLPGGKVLCTEKMSRKEMSIPGRFRARLLRLMLPLISSMKASETFVRGLFFNVGNIFSMIIQCEDNEDWMVSRETISLLRHLYTPTHHEWKECIDAVVATIAQEKGPSSEVSQLVKIGILSFISGEMGAISRGSYVLIKPLAASTLSSETQSLPSGKSQLNGAGGSSMSLSGSGSTAHHIVGNGTNAVITGLCSEEASAGIVSNIDLKNGSCEVILVARNQQHDGEKGKSSDATNLKSASQGRGVVGGRHTLTVRAVRTSLSDVVHASEVPLCLEESNSLESLLAICLPKSLDRIISSGSDDEPSVVACDLLILRCCIVLWSHERIWSIFLSRPTSNITLSKLLEIAWPQNRSDSIGGKETRRRQIKNISQLVSHEARFKYIIGLLRDLNQRVMAMKGTSENEIETRLKNFTLTNDTADTEGVTSATPVASEGTNFSDVHSTNSDLRTSTQDDVANTGRSTSHSTAASTAEDEEENSETAATAAAHLREAAIVQMAELGLPRSWSEYALRRTGGVNIEAAVTFCLERGPEIERMIADEHERDRISNRDFASGTVRRRVNRDSGPSSRLLRQLLEMGFPKRWCSEALSVTGNNVDEALTWILSNGERLSEEDEAIENGENEDNNENDAESVEDDDDDDDEEDDVEGDETLGGDYNEVLPSLEGDNPNASNVDTETTPCWSGSITPLSFISGRAIVDPINMEISGLPAGGFSSVGTKGILLCSGKWYYEAILETAGCLQIGWADSSFAGHCHAERGDGCGDGPSSWAFDGWRRYRWHATATEWGCRWKEGDAVGCLVDMDSRVVSFTLNGEGESIGMGVAFSAEGFRPCGGVYACVSFNRKEKLRVILGGNGSEPFKHQPPTGYRGVGEAVLESVREYENLLSKERILDVSLTKEAKEVETKRFLCDFSDTDHGHELTAWAHRYYGSDASVHLGSGRLKLNASKQISNYNASDQLYSLYLTRRLQKEWGQNLLNRNSSGGNVSTYADLAVGIFDGYDKTRESLKAELMNEYTSIGCLLAKKLLLHLLITSGPNFNLSFFMKEDGNPVDVAFRFWNVVEICTSLRNAGWVGEAGAMAIAAEALGLCISSNDQSQPRSNSDRRGVVVAYDLDENLLLPVGGYTQILTSVLLPNEGNVNAICTCHFKSAAAEAVISSEGGSGILAFLQEGLHAAAISSKEFRDVVVAKIRQSVRHLAVVEYDNDDNESSGKREDDGDEDVVEAVLDSTKNCVDTIDAESFATADARLVCFCSGLLLSRHFQSIDDFQSIQQDLFEAWSVGLLSASLPWRMICAFTAAGILNQNQKVFLPSLVGRPSLARYFGRLQSTVSRRLWAERAAIPVCSRYAQSLVELLTSVNRSVKAEIELPYEFSQLWEKIQVDAATPIPFSCITEDQGDNWESTEGWVSSDSGWEVWTGTVEVKPINWKLPSRSNVRSLMDGGDGPPLVGKGSTVMRGVNWDQTGNVYCNDDGKNLYDIEKLNREKENFISEEPQQTDDSNQLDNNAEKSESDRDINTTVTPDPADESESVRVLNPSSDSAEDERGNESLSAIQTTVLIAEVKKSKKLPTLRLPIGTVISIEPWDGIPAMARQVKWHLTGKEGLYRFGGDGGMYDLCHVEVNSKGTKVKKRYQLPESSEQCAARHGFGVKSMYGIILRIRRNGKQRTIDNQIEHHHDGILEWPDFGAGVRVKCVRRACGTVSIEENELLFGSKDSGWIPRFGEPSYVPGSRFVLSARKREASNLTSKPISYEVLEGSCDFNVKYLRNPANGSPMTVSSEMRLCRGISASALACEIPQTMTPLPPPLTFDRDYCASSLTLSRDNRTISCTSSDSGRSTIFGSLGFTKGVHYWEVKLEQADIGSIFVGVAEKPVGSGSGSSYLFDTPPRLNRWLGWGFVNFRATYSAGAERVFGSHCHAGDTVGVMLDCDSGRVSFFFDGLKYGEHILNDLGCAFENLSPFGFNVDGCGSGGTGQGAPSGFENGSSNRFPAQGTIRPRTLWPVVGLRNHGDRVTISSKWLTSFGTDGVLSTRNIVKVDEILSAYFDTIPRRLADPAFPRWFMYEAFSEYNRWLSDSWIRSSTRGSGPARDTGVCLDVEFDSSPLSCATASAALGLQVALLTGDRVKLTRSAGRILQLAEEAVVLGVYHGRLYYRIVSQKSEGGSLSEGGGRAWCWDESEVVDGLPFVLPSRSLGIPLPRLARFCCNASLKVVYDSGAVLRSDLEIFDGSETVGTICVGSIIPNSTILDRRINSCGGVRFRISSETLGEGWISERIRGGSEELIVEYIDEIDPSETCGQKECYETPLECATVWFDSWKEASNDKIDQFASSLAVSSVDYFAELVSQGTISGLSIIESDSILTSLMNAISNYSFNGDAVESSFHEVAASVAYAHATITGQKNESTVVAHATANQAATLILSKFPTLPSIHAILTRIALLRSFNRRARLALPWLSIRPCQEGSAILGGLHGHGTSPDRSGRTHDSESDHWVQVPSIAIKMRSLRGIFFTSVKRSFIHSVLDATTTSTSLSHDEYELPREIRTVRINRLKAARSMLGDDISAKRKYSVFSQLLSETKSWGGASLRRGFVAKGHGGQKRAFKVKLIGEGVNDYSGPYREAFTDAMADVLKIEPNSCCSLAVLDPTPNNASSIGENRELFMFSLNGRNLTSLNAKTYSCHPAERRIRGNFASLMIGSDESSREVEESLAFLGRLVGTAFRHGISLDIPLPLYAVWKALVEEPVKSSQKLLELDHLAHKQLSREYDANASFLLAWQQRMLNAFTEGLGNVIPVEILPILSGEELREMMCGNPNVDVELLKQVVEYEGYGPNDDVITYFWSTLSEMTNEERKQFLQFVWARNRLPMRESDFDAPFKIQKDTSKGEQALPSASTCFFTLTLPEYTNQEALREKLLFAIRNVTTMETDFQTNTAEIAEGYRSF